MAVNLSMLAGAGAQFFTDSGVILSGGLVYTYAAGTTTPQTTYTTSAGNVAHTNPIVLNSAGRVASGGEIWLTDAVSYKFVLQTSTAVTIATYDNVTGNSSGIYAAFAASSGSSLVGYTQGGTGAVATTVQAKLRESYDAVNDFGCDNTGATNCTTQLLAFYTACISIGSRGRIRAGTYKVTTGVLVFDCNQVSKAWPEIETDGYDQVFFVVDSATATNAPVLTWTNGTALSSSTYQWLGGSHGGFTCTDATGATAANRSVISLKGVNGLQLTNRIVGNGIPGDVITVPSALFGGSNPDPYAVSNLRYDILEANNCTGYAINNLNYVGQDSWVGNQVRAIGGGGGIWGSGSGNKFGELIVANCAGRGYDDGTFVAATGGPAQRNYITIAEIDNVQYPFRFNKTSNTIFLGLRIIHRFNVAPNVSGLYWPRIAVNISGGADANCTNLQLQVFHRIESGGVLANLGVFCTGNNSGNIGNLQMDVDYADNGGLGVTDSLMFSNFATIATGIIQRKSKNLLYQPDRANSYAVGVAPQSLTTGVTNGTTTITYAANTSVGVGMLVTGTDIAANSLVTQVLSSTSCVLSIAATGSNTGITFTASTCVPSAGFFTAASIVAFPSQINTGYQLANYYSGANSTFTAPRAGLYQVNVCIPLTMAASTLCRICLAQNIAGSVVFWSTVYNYAITAANQHYQLNTVVKLAAGDTLCVLAAQATAAPIAITVATSYNEHHFVVTETF